MFSHKSALKCAAKTLEIGWQKKKKKDEIKI